MFISRENQNARHRPVSQPLPRELRRIGSVTKMQDPEQECCVENPLQRGTGSVEVDDEPRTLIQKTGRNIKSVGQKVLQSMIGVDSDVLMMDRVYHDFRKALANGDIGYGYPGTDGTLLSSINTTFFRNHDILSFKYRHVLDPFSVGLRLLYIQHVFAFLFFISVWFHFAANGSGLTVGGQRVNNQRLSDHDKETQLIVSSVIIMVVSKVYSTIVYYFLACPCCYGGGFVEMEEEERGQMEEEEPTADGSVKKKREDAAIKRRLNRNNAHLATSTALGVCLLGVSFLYILFGIMLLLLNKIIGGPSFTEVWLSTQLVSSLVYNPLMCAAITRYSYRGAKKTFEDKYLSFFVKSLSPQDMLERLEQTQIRRKTIAAGNAFAGDMEMQDGYGWGALEKVPTNFSDLASAALLRHKGEIPDYYKANWHAWFLLDTETGLPLPPQVGCIQEGALRMLSLAGYHTYGESQQINAPDADAANSSIL